jgi:hypothetical protein
MTAYIPTSRRATGPAVREAFFVGLVAAWLTVMSSNAGRVSWAAVTLNCLALFVGVVVATAWHEAGHALAARAVGLSVIAAYLGRGRAWRTWVVRGTRLVIQQVPFTGLVALGASSTRWLRVRLMLVHAAGPLANFLIFAAACPAFQASAWTDFALRPIPIPIFATVNIVFGLLNAVPLLTRPRAAAGEARGNDGWNFLAMIFRNDASLLQVLVAHVVWKAPQLMAAGKTAEATALVDDAVKRAPESPFTRLAQSDVLVLSGRWREAAAALRLLVKDAALRRAAPAAIPMLANNLAWADFMQDDPALLDEADRWSAEALTQLRDWPAAHGTRGAVLLAQGKLAEAEERLMFAFAHNQPESRALDACCLAMLEAERGAQAEAQGWVAKARILSPRCPLLARAESRVRASQ